VDAHHARLELSEAGALTLRDLHSVNGTRDATGPLGDRHTTLRSGSGFHIGKTQIRVYEPDHPVPPARSPSIAEQLMATFSQPLVAAGLTLIALGAYLGFDYLQATQEYKIERAVSQGLEFAVGGVIWMLFWGLVSKLARGESHLLAHWCVGAAFLGLTPLTQEIVEWVAFNLQSTTAYQIADGLLSFLIAVASLFIAVAFATHLSRRARWLLALAPALVMLGITQFVPLLAANQENVAVPTVVRISKPPGLLVASPEPLSRFLADTDALFEETSRLAEKAELEARSKRADAAQAAGEALKNTGSSLLPGAPTP
jgi:hypothetical protein